jgi:hypothetical protein
MSCIDIRDLHGIFWGVLASVLAAQVLWSIGLRKNLKNGYCRASACV